MKAIIKPCHSLSRLHGVIDAPPSKSMAHRYLIGAALSGEECTLSGVDYSEDILASIDCLRALGADVTTDGDRVTVRPTHFMTAETEKATIPYIWSRPRGKFRQITTTNATLCRLVSTFPCVS